VYSEDCAANRWHFKEDCVGRAHKRHFISGLMAHRVPFGVAELARTRTATGPHRLARCRREAITEEAGNLPLRPLAQGALIELLAGTKRMKAPRIGQPSLTKSSFLRLVGNNGNSSRLARRRWALDPYRQLVTGRRCKKNGARNTQGSAINMHQ
jgi:hypothetical protein